MLALLTYMYNFIWSVCADHLRIEEISKMLRTGDLGIPVNPADRWALELLITSLT